MPKLALPPLATSVVGSYPQPDWLVDRALVRAIGPPRVRAPQIWRVAPDELTTAQDRATAAAIADQERAGLDIVTDGEIRRESYSNRFATALAGVDLDSPGTVPGRTPGSTVKVPRVTGPIRRARPVQVRDTEFLCAHTDRVVKMTLPGPFTLAMQAVDDHYGSPEKLAMACADAVNEEVRELFAAGADIVQLDEPWTEARHELARDFAVAAIDRALAGARGTTAVHLCFGYANAVKDKPGAYSFLAELDACAADQISIEAAQPDLDLAVLRELPSKAVLVGTIDMSTDEPEMPEQVAGRIRAALDHLPPDRLIVAPDCGMKYLDRDTAFAKLAAMVAGAAIVRAELA